MSRPMGVARNDGCETANDVSCLRAAGYVDLAGKAVYGIPVGGAATVTNCENVCTQNGLNWVTGYPHSQATSTRASLTTAWVGGCHTNHYSVPSVAGEFCGECTYAGAGQSKCLNLAVFVGDQRSGHEGEARGNPGGQDAGWWGAQSGAKALCIER